MQNKTYRKLLGLLFPLAAGTLLTGCVRMAPEIPTASKVLSNTDKQSLYESVTEEPLEESESETESLTELIDDETESLTDFLSPDNLDQLDHSDVSEQFASESSFFFSPDLAALADHFAEKKAVVLNGNQLIPGFALFGHAELPIPEATLAYLKGQIETMIADYDGSWSVCVKDLATDETIVINDEAMPSASLMKLFILGTVYEKITSKELERTSELVDQMSSMIRNSSNEASNALLYKLGGGDYAKGLDVVNEYIRSQGYSEYTIAYNPFQNESIVVNPGYRNQTCARDCAEIFSRIYHRTFSNRKNCNEAEEWMLSQATRYKIPSVIPEGVAVGNKTGETDEDENDTAIVYSAGGDYILSILSTGWGDKNGAQNRIKQISSEVYSYFNDPEYMEKHFRNVR